MLAMIEYTPTGNDTVTNKNVVSIRFSNNIRLTRQFIAAHSDASTKWVFVRMTESNKQLIADLLNNPTAGKVNVPRESSSVEGTDLEVTSGNGNSYARTIASSQFIKTVRPAMHRAGATSVFANL